MISLSSLTSRIVPATTPAPQTWSSSPATTSPTPATSRGSSRFPACVLLSGNHVRHVINRNDLVGRSPGSTASRPATPRMPVTCWSPPGTETDDAAQRRARDRLARPARDANTLALLDYGFGTSALHAGAAGRCWPGPRSRTGRASTRALIAGPAFTRVLPARRPASRSSSRRPASSPGRCPATRLGTAVVLVDGRPSPRIPLVLARRCPRSARYHRGPVHHQAADVAADRRRRRRRSR